MAISERVSKLIWGQCAARCCICREFLVHEGTGGTTSLLGEIAHIVGETALAARGNSTLTIAERNQADNLMLLCRTHHKIVDDDPETYTVANLLERKNQHLQWLGSQLVQARPWDSPISQLSYINVPRLCEQAEMLGLHVDLSRYSDQQNLHSLGWDLNHVMGSFQHVLSVLHVDAVPIETVTVHEAFVGAPISFDRQLFRTKNIPMLTRSSPLQEARFTGSLAKDPHIYTKVGEAKVVAYIDPRWITTSTAMTLFRPPSGQSTFSGIGKVTGVDYETGVLTMTPWAIGIPRGPLDPRPIGGPERAPEASSRDHSKLDGLIDMERAHQDPCHFSPPPTHCDLCRRSLRDHRFMIDGAVEDLGGWACMCADCFSARGRRIAWGHGQLYLKDGEDWLLVGGFPPTDQDSAV